MKTFSLSFFFCVLCLGMLGAAPDKVGGNSIFDYWTKKDLNEITLYIDFSEVEANRKTENSMTGRLFDGEQDIDMKFEVRGRYRRNTCALPPLKLHLNKKGLEQFGFNSHNDFKLVTHCTNDADGQEALLREELTYEIYRQLFPNAAFRTKLIKVNYVDTATNMEMSSYGILIEDTDELRQRLNAEGCGDDCFNLPQQLVSNATEATLFQYMIGNADFSMIMQRNVKLMRQTDGQYVAVLYDFDFSGLVNASYAIPNPHLGQQKVTDRAWIWDYDKAPEMKDARKFYLDNKDLVLDTVENFPDLSDDSKKEITRYLKKFFSELRGGSIGYTGAR